MEVLDVVLVIFIIVVVYKDNYNKNQNISKIKKFSKFTILQTTQVSHIPSPSPGANSPGVEPTQIFLIV